VSARSISMSDLLGRPVRDADGRKIGRVEELNAEIGLHADGNDYVVTSITVGRFGLLDIIASGPFVQQLVRRIARATGYVRYQIPWDWMDLGDPSHPRVRRPAHELPRGDA
jgi:sporulation protein YlmC with PRC-barrel domain